MKKIFLSLAVFMAAQVGLMAQTDYSQDWMITDFEEEESVALDWASADGGSMAIVPDPYDATNNVMQFVRKDGGQIWDGLIKSGDIEVGLAGHWDNVIHISKDATKGYRYFVLRLLKTKDGEVVVKPERKHPELGQKGSEQLPLVGPSRVGKWQTFIFDLADPAYSRANFDLAANDEALGGYNILVIQPDRSAGGNTDTTYIDDMYFTNNPPVIPVYEQVVGDFKAFVNPALIRLSWAKMDAASKYHIYMDGNLLTTLEDNRTVEFEVAVADYGLLPDTDYLFEIEAEDAEGNKTDGMASVSARIMRVAEDGSWAVINDFETPSTWTLWQAGQIDPCVDNPDKSGINTSDKVMKFVRTEGNGLMYGEEGRNSNSNSFATATFKGQKEVFLGMADDGISFKYVQLQVRRPITYGNVILKIDGKNLTPIYADTVAKDSIVRSGSNGSEIKEYIYRNMCAENVWTNYVFSMEKMTESKAINDFQLVVDYTFEDIAAGEERVLFLVVAVALKKQEPIDAETGVQEVNNDMFHMFIFNNNKLGFELKANANCTVNVYNVTGQCVASMNQDFISGFNSVNLPVEQNGVYVVALRNNADNAQQVIKMIVR